MPLAYCLLPVFTRKFILHDYLLFSLFHERLFAHSADAYLAAEFKASTNLKCLVLRFVLCNGRDCKE
ncbi:MAG: hypothetical protein EWV83_15930 [Microcystis sp. M_OC_Ca_00000000_S217Cul]|nr:MAG: hypothetical protein EWV83_15930 [Microcystis sp. M_OC_Ca_00000000_S217Cul]TRT85968.1 MAG: hypothetical protein EWV66_17105 [Microcystis sp. M_OC_Ca_00000000_C217Col]